MLDNKRETGFKELDNALRGGFNFGRLVHIYGESSVGKSTFVCKLLANTGGYSCLIDTEGCFDPIYAKKLGVPTHNLYNVNMKDMGEVFSYLKAIIVKGVFRYIIVDSIAGIASEQIYELIAKELPPVLKLLSQHDTVLIFTNQVRIGKKKKRESAAAHGDFINAMSDVVIKIRDKRVAKGGFESTVEVVKNRCSPRQVKFQLKMENV